MEIINKHFFNKYIGATILREPEKKNGGVTKGAIILSQVDMITKFITELKEYFYIIERRGWEGINESKTADIKLVDDLSTWEETKKGFRMLYF